MAWLVYDVFGAIALLVGVYTFLFLVDWLDGVTSRIAPEEARRRTREWLEQQRSQRHE